MLSSELMNLHNFFFSLLSYLKNLDKFVMKLRTELCENILPKFSPQLTPLHYYSINIHSFQLNSINFIILYNIISKNFSIL